MFINSGVQTFREPFAALSRSFATAAKTHIHMCRCHSDTKSLAWVLERLPCIASFRRQWHVTMSHPCWRWCQWTECFSLLNAWLATTGWQSATPGRRKSPLKRSLTSRMSAMQNAALARTYHTTSTGGNGDFNVGSGYLEKPVRMDKHTRKWRPWMKTTWKYLHVHLSRV